MQVDKEGQDANPENLIFCLAVLLKFDNTSTLVLAMVLMDFTNYLIAFWRQCPFSEITPA